MTTPIPDEAALQALVGRPLPGGEFVIDRWRAWLTHDAVSAPPSDDIAHPVFAYLAATGAMGISWDGLFEWFETSADSGPMFGDCEIAYHQPLRVGATYRVGGEITSLHRKEGRRAGVFDLVGYQLRVDDGKGVLVATCRNSLVIPRRS